MITRIEIDGFKSFVDFGLDVQPFTVLLGPNAGGKSNVIDALQALAGIAGGADLDANFVGGRGLPVELFHQREDETRVEEAKLSCEVLTTSLPGDKLLGLVGLEFRGLLRYEPSLPRVHARAGVTGWSREKVQTWQQRGASVWFVETVAASLLDEQAYPCRLRRQYASSLFRREASGWQFLSLAPSAMRDRALKTDAGPLAHDGRNIAAVLGRVRETDVMWSIVADAVALIPGLQDIRVVDDRDFWELELKFRGTGWISPRIASDGTLRVVAMLAAIHDPDHSGVLVVDEVENGLHPARLTELLRRLRNRVTDWRDGTVPNLPTRQVILTTHSPVVLSALYPEHSADLVFLTTAYRPETVDGRKVGSLVTMARPVGQDGVPLVEVRRVLETVQPVG